MPKAASRTADELYRDLCLFDEHTWGSSLSVAKPYSLDTLGQFNEKSRLAWRPMARAEWLLAQRARLKLVPEGEGLFVVNPAPATFCGWVSFLASALRDSYTSVEDPVTGARMKIYFEPGIEPWGRPSTPADLSPEDVSATFPDLAPKKLARFWMDGMAANSVSHLRLSKRPAGEDRPADDSRIVVVEGEKGWPASVQWPEMPKPLFVSGFGEFAAVQVKGFASRWILADIRSKSGEARDRMRQEHLQEVKATATGPAVREETPHTIVFTQSMEHPRLAWAVRVLELWKREPRARLTFRLNRISSAAPEIFYLDFPFPTGAAIPRLSSGGLSFRPFTEQLGETCRDYFAVDGWADYETPEGNWLWVSRDAPLISLGADPTLSRRMGVPSDVHRLRAMLLNNFWYTNFLADEPGIMEFQFDLAWRKSLAGSPAAQAEALVSEPVVLINPAGQEDPRVLKRLYEP